MRENADMYLDKINETYDIERMRSKYVDAINNSNDVKIQERLNTLLQQQLKILNDKEKVTKYDVERAEKLLDIELKRIALEDAQKNKSQMRLRRDAAGNYSYEFVANQQAIAKAEQDKNNAEQELWNFDKDAFLQNQEQAYKSYEDFMNAYKETASDTTLTEEQRQLRLSMLREQYEQRMNFLTQRNADIRNNILAQSYGENVDAFKDMMDNLIPTWDQGVQQMIDKFATDPDGFMGVIGQSLDEIDAKFKEFQQNVETMMNSAGVNIGQLNSGIDITLNYLDSIVKDGDEVLSDMNAQLDKMLALQAAAHAYAQEWQSIKNSAIAALQAAKNLYEQEKIEEFNAGINEMGKGGSISGAGSGASAGAMSGSKGTGSQSEPSKNGSGSGGGNGGLYEKNASNEKHGYVFEGTKYYTNTESEAKIELAKRIADETEKLSNAWKYNGQSNYLFSEEERKAVADSYALAAKNSQEWWLKHSSTFDTGGYTGTWDNTGRLAMLHQKQLVLNATDTANILKVVDLVRDMNILALSRMDQLSGAIPSYSTLADGVNSIEQTVHIDASFPNVSNSNEIENALNNLINRASQYALDNRR